MIRPLALGLALLAIASAGNGGNASERNEFRAGIDKESFQRPAGIYAIGLRAQPPPRELLEKPFVDGVALAQEWRTVEPARNDYDFSTIDATLATLEPYKKKLVLTIFPFRAPDYLINDPQAQTYLVAHAGPNITLPVPWDATGLQRYEALFQALAEHLVPDAAQGGAQVRFRDHPLMAGMPAWPMGMNGIRDVCLAGGRCPAIYDVPNYSREALTNGILRSLHVVVDQFPNQFHYVPLFRISDQTTSPPLDEHLLAVIKQDFFNGSRPPQMGLYQENLSCLGPNTAGAPALFKEQNNTYTMIQALQSWLTLAPFNSPGSTDPCLVTTVPNDRTTAVSGPEVGIQHAYQTFGCRYFEIYLADLLHPGFADEFEQWSKILNSPSGDTESPAVSEAALSKKKVKRKTDPTLTITWTSSDNVAVASHDIEFAEDGVSFSSTVMAGLAGNEQSFTWTVPDSLPKTGTGRIKIIARDAVGNAGEAVSGKLKIK